MNDKAILTQKAVARELLSASSLSEIIRRILRSAINKRDIIIISGWLKGELGERMYFVNMAEIAEESEEGANLHFSLLIKHLKDLQK